GSHLAGAGKQEVLASWDVLHGEPSAGQLLRQVVLALRLWRPDEVVTDPPGAPGCGGLVAEVVREAFDRAGDPSAFPEQLKVLGELGPMLAELPDDQGAPAAHAVARHYARMGQWGLAREAFLLLVDRYPAHPLAADACRWLVQHNSSSEARRRHELGQFLVV